jgi:hypothetical protein
MHFVRVGPAFLTRTRPDRFPGQLNLEFSDAHVPVLEPRAENLMRQQNAW